MTNVPATTSRTLASRSRLRILQLLRGTDEALDIAEIGDHVGLHANTAREHLQLLIDAGFVEADSEHRPSRGRPRMRYRAVERPAAATVDERLRSRMIDLLLASYGAAEPDEGGRAGVDADVRHTSSSAAATSAGGARDAIGNREAFSGSAQAARQLANLELHFEDLGFDPEVTEQPLDVHFYRCPMMSLAKRDTELVCAVHEDLARGVLAQEPGPVEVESLHPFVGPRHCVLHLRSRDSAPPTWSGQ